MEIYETPAANSKKRRATTDFVTPRIVIPALIGSVVLFAWLNGMF